MRNPVFVLIAIITIGFAACDPCNNLDCATSNYYGYFTLKSLSTQKDLVFGPYKVYDKNAIKFYSLKGSDTTFYNYQPTTFKSNGIDSVLQVQFFPKTDTAYMRLSNGDIDTLSIFYRDTESKCCGTITDIIFYKYNQQSDILGAEKISELKK